jgi:cyclase
MSLKRILFYLGGMIVIGMICLLLYIYPFYTFFFSPEFTAIDKNLTIMSGAGNSGILVTDSAVVVIDTKMGFMAKDLYKLVKEKAGSKKIIVINTHLHGDHIYGNKYFKGCPIYMGGYSTDFIQKNIKPEYMPTVFVNDSLIIPLGDETIALYNMGQAHTFADLVVYLQHRKLLFTGDIVFNRINPALIRKEGTDLFKWIKVLDLIPSLWNIKTIIPGHGVPGGPELTVTMKQYFEDMHIAAIKPDKAPALFDRYNDWMRMPLMSSPDRTVDFFHGH